MATPINLAHSVGECLYHIVFIPKYRKKVLYGTLRMKLGTVLRELAQQKECIVHEGHLMADHVHMLIKAQCVERHRLHQREKCNLDCPELVRKAAQLWRRALLGQGLPCEYCRPR